MSSTSEIRQQSILRRLTDEGYTEYSDAARRDLTWLLETHADDMQRITEHIEGGNLDAALALTKTAALREP